MTLSGLHMIDPFLKKIINRNENRLKPCFKQKKKQKKIILVHVRLLFICKKQKTDNIFKLL